MVENTDLPRPMSTESPIPAEDGLVMIPPGESFSEEEGEREWLPHHSETREPLDGPRDQAEPTPSVVESAEEPEWRRYRETLLTVYRYNENISPPKPQVEEVLESVVSSLYQARHKEERYVALPQSGALTNSFRQINGAIKGVARSPLSPAGRVKEDAQKWGTHVSLTTPVLRQYRSEYYQITHSESLPMEERVFPSTPWSVSSADSITRQAVPAEVRVKMTQLRDWEMLARASLGVVNHLDWFLGSVGRIVASVDLSPEKSADARNLLTAAGTAMLHLAQLQARTLGSNATVRREAILGMSVLERADAAFIRSQGIGTLDLLGGQAESVLRAASEARRTLEPFRAPNNRPPRSVTPSGTVSNRGSFGPGSRRRRGGGGTSSGARARPRFQATTSTSRRSAVRGRRGYRGATRGFEPRSQL